MTDKQDAAVAAWEARPWRARWHEVARYTYLTPDKRMLFQHVRWATKHPSGIDPKTERPKTFTYRHWVHGQTRIGLPDGLSEAERHLIYRLPELARYMRCLHLLETRQPTHPPRDEELFTHVPPPLVICEGEKDVIALVKHGWLATTAHGGAMHGWGVPEWQWLVDIGWPGDVWLAVDSDQAGWYHTMKALRALDELRATRGDEPIASVRCVRAVVGKDVSDALAKDRGDRWWEMLLTDEVIALGEAVERKLGTSGGGRLSGYLTPEIVGAWKNKQMSHALEQEDW
jgi:hypothetical protein